MCSPRRLTESLHAPFDVERQKRFRPSRPAPTRGLGGPDPVTPGIDGSRVYVESRVQGPPMLCRASIPRDYHALVRPPGRAAASCALESWLTPWLAGALVRPTILTCQFPAQPVAELRLSRLISTSLFRNRVRRERFSLF